MKKIAFLLAILIAGNAFAYSGSSISNSTVKPTGKTILRTLGDMFGDVVDTVQGNKYNDYVAYGDETTNETSAAANTPTDQYPYIISQDSGTRLTYQTLFYGKFDCDIVDQKIFPTSNPGNSNNPLVTWLPAAADPAWGSPGSGAANTAHKTITNSCRMAGLTWMTIPASSKVLGQSASCVKTGTWTDSAKYGGNYGTVSNTSGDTVACTITSNGGPVYFWYGLKENDGGTFTYSIDGGAAVALTTNANNEFSFPVTSKTSVAAIRLPNLAASSHTVTFTVTSATNASNTVTIYGLGTPPKKKFLGGNPSVFIGGQIKRLNDSLPLATANYNADISAQAEQLKIDGLNVNFVDVRKYVNSTTDMTGGVNDYTPNATGKQKLAEAFAGTIQFIPNTKGVALDPRAFGAACNTRQFTDGSFSSTNNSVTTTSGSPWITIAGYTFKDGVATQTGGGDVGKVISIFGMNTDGFIAPTTYIAEVDTALNRAKIGVNAAASSSNSWALIGGYPTDPSDPSTARDDTAAIQNTSAVAVAAGVETYLPNNCLIHDLDLADHATLQGTTGGLNYGDLLPASKPPSTVYIASNGLGSDPHFGIKLGTNADGTKSSAFAKLRDFRVQCNTFPALARGGQTLAGIGAETPMTLDPGSVMIENVSFSLCPVNFGVPFGMNQPVTFTASQSGTTMTVASIDSTGFSSYYGLRSSGVLVTVDDWLANNRTVTQATFTASQAGNTLTVSAVASGALAVGQAIQSGGSTSATITALGTGTGGTGTYTLSNSATVTSRTWTSGTAIVAAALGGRDGDYTVANSITLASQTMTSPAANVFLTARLDDNQFYNGGINVNGNFSDLTAAGNIHTGGFTKCAWLGPDTSAPGNAANRFALERYEACNNGAIVIDGTNSTTGAYQFTGEHFQFNGGYAVETIGTVNDISFTGGTFQGNGTSTSNAPIRAHIALGGTTTNFSVDAAQFLKDGGGSTANYLIGTTSGSSGVDYVSITGGDGRQGYATSPYNWAGNTPTNFKLDVPFVPREPSLAGVLDVFPIPGAQTVADDKTSWVVKSIPGTITSVRAVCKTAPVGSALIFDIDKSSNTGTSWTSIWASTPANKIQLADGAKSGTQTSFDTTTFSAGDVFRINVDQIGSGTAGSDCTVQMVTVN
jgi:hypothetical protein